MMRGSRLFLAVCLLFGCTFAQPLHAAHPQLAATQPKNDTVYITRTGKKFHRDGCRSLSRSKIPVRRADAIARGYGACKICKP